LEGKESFAFFSACGPEKNEKTDSLIDGLAMKGQKRGNKIFYRA